MTLQPLTAWAKEDPSGDTAPVRPALPVGVMAAGASAPLAVRDMSYATVCFGDSITRGHQGDATPVVPYPSLLSWMLAFRGCPTLVVNRGVDGNKIADLLARVQLDVIAQAPSECVVLIGTNDLVNGTPLSTMTAQLVTLTTTLLDAGVRPTFCAVLPRSDQSAGIMANIRAWNRWLGWTHCPSYGLQFIDTYSAFANADGTPLAGFLADGRHPTASGYNGLAAKIAASLMAARSATPLVNESPWIIPGEPNGVQVPTFTPDTNADGAADHWYKATSGGTTGSLALSAHPLVGNWQALTFNGGADMTKLASVLSDFVDMASIGLHPGGNFYAAFDLDTDATVGATNYFRGRVQFFDAGGVNGFDVEIFAPCYGQASGLRVSALGAIAALVPASGLAPMQVRFCGSVYGTGTATARFGRVLITPALL